MADAVDAHYWWYAPVTIRALLVGSMWREGSTIRVDEAWIRW